MKRKKMLMIFLAIFAIAAMLGILPGCTKTPTEPADQEEESTPKFVAHRGFSHSYVDNTEESFKAAAQKEFYGIETDIRKTKDGYYVCNHDAKVKYADGSEKRISATTLDTLLSKPLQNDKTDSDAYLCTFEKYLQVCKSGNKVAVIEMKDWFLKSDIQEILSIIDAEYDRKKVIFISFLFNPLLLVKEADPSIELQYLSQTENDKTFDTCLQKKISIDVKQTILTEELVKQFHDAGLKVNVWTVDKDSELQVAIAAGVDYVTSNLLCEY